MSRAMVDVPDNVPLASRIGETVSNKSTWLPSLRNLVDS
jgi:hypothetical protein